MWGSENWGEMVWGGGGTPVPLLDPLGLVLLVAVLLISTTVVLRRRQPPR